jgi:hypothetical protein
MEEDAMSSISTVKDSPVYVIMDGGFSLDASVDVAWGSVVDFPSWQGFSSIERISGVIGAEEEVFLLVKNGESFDFPPFYARTLRVEPHRRIIWKTFPADVLEGTGFVGIVEFRLESAEAGTSRFSYHSIYEFNGPFSSEAERLSFRNAQYDDFSNEWKLIGPKLEELVVARRMRPVG